MAPYCSTARWMPLHKGLYAQEPQYWHEAEQPISITFGRISEGSLRSTCALKQLLSCTKDNHPGQTSKSHLRLRFCICQASNQAAFTPQAHCTWMKDGEMFHRGEPFPQAEGDRRSQVWMHGLALSSQKQRAEAHTKHGKSGRDWPWQENTTDRRTYPCKQQISINGCSLRSHCGVFQPELLCCGREGECYWEQNLPIFQCQTGSGSC